MDNVMPERPAVCQDGDVWLQSVAEILTWNDSIDCMGENLADVLEGKRHDHHYGDVLESIRELGFVRPLTVIVNEDGQPYKFGDGHHRLAAAIDLGMTHVPVEAYTRGWDCVSPDSGGWTSRRGFLPANNPRDDVDHPCIDCHEGAEVLDVSGRCWVCVNALEQAA